MQCERKRVTTTGYHLRRELHDEAAERKIPSEQGKKIDRFFKEKENKELVTHEVDIKGHEDLVINGLGFIKFTKNEHVKISVPKEVSIYVRKSLV